jgi:hypothetical protein
MLVIDTLADIAEVTEACEGMVSDLESKDDVERSVA